MTPPLDDPHALGPRLRALRRARGLSLRLLAAETGVSEATLSRIETGASPVTAPHLYALARALGTDVASFFAPATPDAGPSLTRAGTGPRYDAPRLEARVLNADRPGKAMHPFLNRTTARTTADAGGLAAHGGEEWLYVLSGQLTLAREGAAPFDLGPGDSLYFDPACPHAYLATGPGPAEFLVVTTAPSPESAP